MNMRMSGLAAGVALAAGLALAGCGARPDPSTPEGQCEIEAYKDPQVQILTTKSISNSIETRSSAMEQRDIRVSKLVEGCLGRQGLAPLGGVERPEP